MADEDLKKHISNEFNRVSAPKIVRVNELVSAFANRAAQRLGPAERFFGLETAVDRMKELNDPTLRAEGVYTGTGPQGTPETYVSSTFLRKKMLEAVDKGEARGLEDVAARLSTAAVEAVAQSEDHTAKARAGLLKPKAP
jgi:hypothetical protein